jgi:hypothetical protein
MQPLHDKISEQDAIIANLTNEILQMKENEAA